VIQLLTETAYIGFVLNLGIRCLVLYFCTVF